jgi:3-oxoacyl-[acyl-carrier-protein] synthase II
MAIVSALGPDLQTTWQRLLRGESGITLQQPYAELPTRPLGMIGKSPAALVPLTQAALAAVLADAGLKTPLPNCGVVIGSSRGCQYRWEQLAKAYYQLPRELSMPGLDSWLETFPYTAGMAVARELNTTAAVLSPMAACATGLWAIAQGYELIQQGHHSQVLVGAVETPVTPLTLSGFAQMGALAINGAFPFDRRRQGFVLGEAAALLMLEPLEMARARTAKIYGEILGFGLSADAENITAPSQSLSGATAALQQCLRQATQLRSIDYIHAHGTGTKLNDAGEARLIQSFFPKGVAVSSTKGATGHSLGASGALGAVFCLLALSQQVLPPNWGLQDPEFDLDLVRVARPYPLQAALCLSFGFGGQNAALAIGRID